MKKVIALVMCVAMIACVAVTAAAEEVAVTFSMNTVEDAKVGDVVTIDMSVAEAKTMIGAIGFQFDYDETYLKFVESPVTYNYFSTGVGAGGATAAGNEETMQVQMATADGFKAPGVVLSLSFEVIEEIPAGETAVVSCSLLEDVEVKAADGDNTYNITITNGGVKGEAVEEPSDPSDPSTTPSTPVVVPSKPADTVTDTTTDGHKPLGDASAVAVAAGLCAVMAAAFVFTKKAR